MGLTALPFRLRVSFHFHISSNNDPVKNVTGTAQKMKFFIKDFFSKCDQIRRKLRIWSHLLKTFLMEKFIFSATIHRTIYNHITGKSAYHSKLFWILFKRNNSLSVLENLPLPQVSWQDYLLFEFDYYES